MWLELIALAAAILVVRAIPTINQESTMSDESNPFGHLKHHNIDPKRTAELTLTELVGHPSTGGHPIIEVVCAGEENTGLTDASLRREGSKTKKRTRSNKAPTVAELRDDRDAERPLYARYVLVGWKGMCHVEIVEDDDGEKTAKTGELIPYTEEMGKKFCQSVPPRTFNEMRLFALDETNFQDEVIDVEATAEK